MVFWQLDRTRVLCRLKLKREKKDESYLGIITLADFELDSDHESSFPEDLVQAYENSLREVLQHENQVEFTSADLPRLPQPVLGSQNNSFPSNIYQLTNTVDPSGMDTSLDNEEDEDVGDVQNADLAYAEDVLMNRRARTTDSVHGFVPLKEKKGVVENKFNGSPFASEKPMPRPVTGAPHRPMAPPVRPASVKCYRKDEEQRFEKVKRETAVINIKPERISLDETAARAKVIGYKERGSAGNSTKKTYSKEIEYAREKSHSVAASTGTTSESTETSTNPPLANLVNVLIGIYLLLTITRNVFNF
ncbi:hypothetical protein NL676_038399 [Syzygium grande]|nr:hypothetical protein NL676_038399 [Syzygium grande]